MSVLLEGITEILDEEASWSGTWQFSKDKKAGVAFNYNWVSCSLPRDLLDYVSFIPSPNSPAVVAVAPTSGRGRGRGRGRVSSGSGRGTGRAVADSSLTPFVDQLQLDANFVIIETDRLGNSSDGLLSLKPENSDSGKNTTELTEDTEKSSNENQDESASILMTTESDQDEPDNAPNLGIDPEVTFNAAVTEAGAVSNKNEEIGTVNAADETVRISTPVTIERNHPLFGLWNGTFDVRGANGVMDKVYETFFFHSFMNQEPSEELLDLPQEPQFTSLILRRNRVDARKSLAGSLFPRVTSSDSVTASATSSSSIPSDETSRATNQPIGLDDTGGVSATEAMDVNEDGLANAGEADGDNDGDNDADAALVSEDAPEAECTNSNSSSRSTSITADVTHPPAAVGEPFTKYLVGFGRNPFGRFALTAAYNETTGRMRCEKKYILTKGSGRRGRRPGTTFAGAAAAAAARLSIESAAEGGIGGEGASTVRAMSTRPRKSLSDSSFYFPPSYDEAQQLLATGAHTKKRKSIGFEDIDASLKSSKDKSGTYPKCGSGLGSASHGTAFHVQREKERDRDKVRDKERDVEQELDESNSDYRVAFLDEDSGEVYEGGWFPQGRRRHGAGVCMYADGSLYEGGWAMGREHGKGQLMTGDRQIIYSGEWVDGTMTGHGTYTFANGDTYTGDWREGIRHGKGEYVISNGCSYMGDWKNNKRTGSGVFHWADGSSYEGDWENDNRHGRGLLILANGFRYDGGWYQNYMEGRGLTVFPGGQEYQGSYKAGLREGRGSIKFASGAVYEGRFRDDKIDGQGTIVVTETMPGAEEGEILIPIQIQADIRRIHLKAGFGADAAH